MRGFAILVLAFMLTGWTTSARANLVTDPGFESCTGNGNAPPDWSVTSADIICSTPAHSGIYSALFSSGPVTLSQSISTTAGDNYDFSFWVLDFTSTGSTFTASFGGDDVFNQTSPGIVSPFVLEDFTVTASGTSAIISFTGDLPKGGEFLLDDVSVTDEGPAPAPEPASLILLGTGLLGLRLIRRRR